jgi:Alkylmercury lyase
MIGRNMPAEATIDRAVRVAVFEHFGATGGAPRHEQVAAAAGIGIADTRAAYRRLADAHVIVLAPGTDEIWMAAPYSAIATPFRVHAGDRAYWGNCIWDALGIVALRGGSGRVEFNCPDCGDPLAVDVRDNTPAGDDPLVHFAVPAARWWDDIGFT